jgi:hypothetical protein
MKVKMLLDIINPKRTLIYGIISIFYTRGIFEKESNKQGKTTKRVLIAFSIAGGPHT